MPPPGRTFQAIALFCLIGAPAAGAAPAPALTFTDTVAQLQDQGDRTRVFFHQHAAIYALSHHREGWQDSLAALQASLENRSRVRVDVDPLAITILNAKPE